MKKNLFKTSLLLAPMLALPLLAPHASATPYASGVTNDGAGNITYVLSENADDVKVIFDINTSTNDYPSQAKGTYTFSLGATTNFQIVVYKKSLNGYTAGPGIGGAATTLKISTDTTPVLNTYFPTDVSVNRNPKSPYFGRIYICNAESGTTSTFVSRPTTVGMYLVNADQTDAVGQGDASLTGGYPMDPVSSVSPFKAKVGEDDNLYICDWSDATGNLFRTDPNVTTASGVYALQAEDHISCALGGGGGLNDADFPVGTCNTHGSIPACYVAGSEAAGNLKIYTIDEDLQDNHTSTSPTQLNSLWRYDANSGPLPYNSNPTRLWTASSAAKDGIDSVSIYMALDRAPDGKFFITSLRSNGSECGLVVRDSTGATTLFNSRTMSTTLNSPATVKDYLVSLGSVAVARDDKWVAVGTRNTGTAAANTVWIIPLTNGIPDLSKRNILTTGASTANNGVSFDAAGNLYLVNNGAEALRIFSPGGTSITTYSNDSTGVSASFSVKRIDPDLFTAPQNITANAGTAPAFTATGTGSGTIKYQWTRSGTNVAGATKSNLSFADVQQPSASPNYAVVVTSTGGSITSSVVSLTVIDTAPIITTDLPATRTVNAGTTNTFSIVTTGTDPRSYQWRFNGVDVPGATTTSYTRADVQVANDQGTYSVVITNTISPFAVTSTLCALTITDTQPIFTVNPAPASQTVGAGANVTFSVATTGTDPRFYQWQKNFVDIPSATSTSYTAVNLQVEDSGAVFSCNASNVIGGPVSSSTATVTVTNRLPVIITQPAITVVPPGANTNFTVVAQGENPLTYQWSKNGAPVSGATDSSLPVTVAQLTDAGFYSVVVTSTGGNTTSASAQLVVTQTPFATGTGTGLLGEYRTVQVRTFTNAPTLTRIDTTVDTNYATGSPAPSISVDNFTARWSGQVQPLYSQGYTFYDASDDGSRLWVNGLLIVDHWVPQGITETASPTTLSLVAGQKYDLVMEYFEQTSTAEVHLRWSSASQVKQAIPMTQLYPATAPVQPKLSASVVGTDLVLQWMGSYTLQSAPDLNTAFANVVTVTNIAPYTNGPLSLPQQYLRLKAY